MVFYMSIDQILSIGFIGKYINSIAEKGETHQAIIWAVGALLCAVIAYLLGSLNFAIIISGRSYKQDIRNYGSKNAGMTNMMRTYGKKAAALTLLGDALKAVLAGVAGYALLGHHGAYIAGCACVIGHMFPVYYKFKGGKGVVTAAVSILMCNPFVFLIVILLFVIIVAATKYISLGSIMCSIIYPFLLNAVSKFANGGNPSPFVIYALLIAVLVVFKHKENFKRLREGKESKFSFKKSVKPEDVKEDK